MNPPGGLAAALLDRAATQHAEEVARGEHDDKCEYQQIPGWYLCNCSMRRRVAKGLTTVPELEFVPPTCLGCGEETETDADGFNCERCNCSWDFNGKAGDFYDDHGDLWGEIQRYRAEQAQTPAERPVTIVQLPEAVNA